MSGSSRLCRLGLFVLALVLAGAPAICADDLLDLQRRRNAVAADKLEQEIARGLADARTLERTDPVQAERILRGLRTSVENDRYLLEQRRAELLRQIELRFRDIQVQVRLKQDAELPPLGGSKSTRPAPIDTGGKGAAQKADDFVKGGQAYLDQMKKNKAQRDFNSATVLRDIDKSPPIPGDGGVAFPKYWKELMALRKPYSGPKLTEREATLLKALDSTLSENFDKTAFRDVLNVLQERTNQTILIDENTRKEANLEYDDPVDFKFKKLAFRTVLKKILGDKGLTYIIRDGVIEVMTPQKAREITTVRVYPIGDLLPTPDPRLGPFLGRAQMLQSAASIIQMIQTSVEPGSWQANGGTGTIVFNEANQTLVIRNSAEMHFTLPQLFAGGGR